VGPDRRPVPAPPARARRPAGGRPADAQRHLPAAAHRRPRARPARALWVPHGRLTARRRSGLLGRVIGRLQPEPNEAGLIDPEPSCIDGTNARAARAAAGAAGKTSAARGPDDPALGRGRGGFGTKAHLVSDGNGLPLAAEVTPGQRQGPTPSGRARGQARIPGRRGRPVKLAGDKGDSDPRARRGPRRRGIRAVIPRRKGQRPGGGPARFDKAADRRRAVVGQRVGRLKGCRAVATRFDRLAVNYLATVKRAMIQRCLRVLTRL
jgi:transposase